ncbi:MAG TPA: hypothetical protein VN956_04855 [Pyrinomonadaceae bacterium]|nr:hypothetical protein [Pyrinomonadaceae bacterium]
MRIIRITATFIALAAIVCAPTTTTFNRVSAKQTVTAFQDRDPMKPLQHVVASKTAKFETVDKDDAVYKNALDAHDLAGSLKLVGKEGSFRGTVSKFFEERDGDLIVFDFDPNFRTALTAVLRNVDFPKFPDVKTLDGKEIVVSGKFLDYHGKAQIELTDPKQIRIVK